MTAATPTLDGRFLTYPVSEAARLSYVSPLRLRDWWVAEVLVPSSQYVARWSLDDIVAARVIGAVVGIGDMRSAIFHLTDKVRRMGPVVDEIRKALARYDMPLAELPHALEDVFIAVPVDGEHARVATSRRDIQEAINDLNLACAANLGVVVRSILELGPRSS